MRVLLLFNPNATRTGLAVAQQVADRLGPVLKVDVEATKRRDHASYLAAGAAHEGYEVVAVLGGDGTLNEVVQGLVGTDVRLAVLPGGSTNVFARTLGLPNDVMAATDLTRERLLEHRDRRIGLGLANGRYFTFSAGYGYDAEVVRMVEERARLKRAVRQATFLWCGVMASVRTTAGAAEVHLQVDRGEAGGQAAPDEGRSRLGQVRLVSDRGELGGLVSAVCCSSDPYTYLGPLAARLLPGASPEGGLDLLGLTSVRLPGMLRLLRRALLNRPVTKLPHIRTWHDADRYELRSERPLPWHVDGDYVGTADALRLRRVPDALTVVA